MFRKDLWLGTQKFDSLNQNLFYSVLYLYICFITITITLTRDELLARPCFNISNVW